MRKIRVLIVDDSVVIRRLLSDILAQDLAIEVAGSAPNGKIALAKLPQLNPDLITLDIEMPVLDGLETLTALRATYAKLPVIMFSTLTERGAGATLEALARGATDYVTKPANIGSVAAGVQSVRQQLIPKIKALCPGVATATEKTPAIAGPTKNALATRRLVSTRRCDAVVIGSSTGGPQALATVLSKLPHDFPVPIIVVQHMPPIFTLHLARRLNDECRLEVAEACGDETLRPGRVLIAPGGRHLELRRQATDVRTALHDGPPENSCRPAVDVLFRSAADVYGAACTAVVLTGMGQDGLRGAQHLVRAGGDVLAQDEATSVVWGMPRAVAQAGCARSTLPLPLISTELVRVTAVGRRPAPLVTTGS